MDFDCLKLWKRTVTVIICGFYRSSVADFIAFISMYTICSMWKILFTALSYVTDFYI